MLSAVTSSGLSKRFDAIFVGCAGWSFARDYANAFPGDGTLLSRYAKRFPAVEINSTFYGAHRPTTYARWSESVPDGFRFSIKVPKQVTHEHHLVEVNELLDRFLSEATQLGARLGPLLVQLPPSLPYSARIARSFLCCLRDRFEGNVALEPRHASWFVPSVNQMLMDFRVARVAVDPAVVEIASEPGGWNGLHYYRLHGSPKVYFSSYGHEYLEELAMKLLEEAKSSEVWCIFDNTALGAAITNGLEILGRLGARGVARD